MLDSGGQGAGIVDERAAPPGHDREPPTGSQEPSEAAGAGVHVGQEEHAEAALHDVVGHVHGPGRRVGLHEPQPRQLVRSPGAALVKCIYTTNAFGSPTVLLDSGNGLPDARTIGVGTHAHANWAFEAAGTYTVGFEVTATKAGGGTVSTGITTYTFTVDP